MLSRYFIVRAYIFIEILDLLTTNARSVKKLLLNAQNYNADKINYHVRQVQLIHIGTIIIVMYDLKYDIVIFFLVMSPHGE